MKRENQNNKCCYFQFFKLFKINTRKILVVDTTYKVHFQVDNVRSFMNPFTDPLRFHTASHCGRNRLHKNNLSQVTKQINKQITTSQESREGNQYPELL